MDFIAASSDRVVIHQALKHLIVGGNALLFMSKDGLKTTHLIDLLSIETATVTL